MNDVYITVQHTLSGARKRLELLKFSRETASVWWPLCGVYTIKIATGQLLNFDESGLLLWRMIDADLSRLRRGRPVSRRVAIDPNLPLAAQ